MESRIYLEVFTCKKKNTYLMKHRKTLTHTHTLKGEDKWQVLVVRSGLSFIAHHHSNLNFIRTSS